MNAATRYAHEQVRVGAANWPGAQLRETDIQLGLRKRPVLDQRRAAENAVENLQSRLRGSILMSISNAENRLLLSTGNKSELALGYCTLYGDTNGGLAVIGDVLKTETNTDSNCAREVFSIHSSNLMD